MTREELLSFLPGAKVTRVVSTGSTYYWVNGADGTFVVSTDNKKHGSVMGTQGTTSPGTWMVDDQGRYCINIEWRRESEKWCAFIIKADDGYYLNKVEPRRKIEFEK